MTQRIFGDSDNVYSVMYNVSVKQLIKKIENH